MSLRRQRGLAALLTCPDRRAAAWNAGSGTRAKRACRLSSARSPQDFARVNILLTEAG